MINKLQKYSTEEYTVFLLVLCTLGIIGSKKISLNGIDIYIEISLISGIVFLIYQLYKMYSVIDYRENFYLFSKTNKNLFILIATYIGISLVKGVFWGVDKFLYQIVKVFPMVLLVFLAYYFFCTSSEIKKKYFNFATYIFIISFVLALIMFSFGYTNGAFSFDTILHLVSFGESKELFQEIRLYWLLSHKSRFAVYCTIGLIFLLKNKYINKKARVIGIISSSICTVLSNSMTGLGIYLFILFIFVSEKYKLLNKLKNNKKILWGTLITIISIIVIGFVVISQKRDLSTLGARTFIWKGSINQIYSNIFGVGAMPNEFWITGIDNGTTYYFTNAHNIYLNEMLENGVGVGIIYIGIIVSLVYVYLKEKDMISSCLLILIFGVFSNLESLNVCEMPYILIVTYLILYYTTGTNNIKGENNEEDISDNMHL